MDDRPLSISSRTEAVSGESAGARLETAAARRSASGTDGAIHKPEPVGVSVTNGRGVDKIVPGVATAGAHPGIVRSKTLISKTYLLKYVIARRFLPKQSRVFMQSI